jgi:hypothetical protein
LKRLIVSAVVAAFALAFAGSALASYTPKLVVSQAGTKTTIHVTIAKEDDATLKLTIYAPTTAPATLGQAPGSTIGTVSAQVNAKAISPDAILPLTGVVQVADGTAPALAAAATQCTQTTAHAATWVLVLTAAGQTLQVPAWVDPTAGAEAAFGAGKLTVCLPSPDIPTSAGGATFGAKLLDVNFTVDGIFGASSAPLAIWPSVFTPYVAGTGTPNPAGTVLALGIEAQPTFTLAAKAGKKGKVTFSGKLSASGIGGAGASIVISEGSKKLASTKTSASGSYTASAKLKKGSHTVRAKATAADTDVTAQGCAAAPAGAPKCVSATVAGVSLTSNAVKVKVK